MKKIAVILVVVLSLFNGYGQKLKSPNETFEMNFSLSKSGEPTYALYLKGKEVIKPSKLGFYIKDDKKSLVNDFELVNEARGAHKEMWNPVWGEESAIKNHYNELAVTLKQKETNRKLIVRFRLFDEGLGFRYEFPEQKELIYFIIKEERTEFAMTGDHTALWIPGDYDTQEYDYTESKLSEISKLF